MKNIEHKQQQAEESEYRLTGRMGMLQEGQHNPDTFFGVNLDETFRAVSDDVAIAEAKSRIEKFITNNPKHDPASFPPGERGTDYWEHGFSFRLKKEIFTMSYCKGKPAKPEVPARPAIPAQPQTPDYIKETIAI